MNKWLKKKNGDKVLVVPVRRTLLNNRTTLSKKPSRELYSSKYQNINLLYIHIRKTFIELDGR